MTFMFQRLSQELLSHPELCAVALTPDFGWAVSPADGILSELELRRSFVLV